MGFAAPAQWALQALLGVLPSLHPAASCSGLPHAHWRSPTGTTPAAGGPATCQAGATFTVASTVPGEQAALASPNEQFVLLLRSSGLLDISDRATGRQLFSAGPFTTCKGPYRCGPAAAAGVQLCGIVS